MTGPLIMELEGFDAIALQWNGPGKDILTITLHDDGWATYCEVIDGESRVGSCKISELYPKGIIPREEA